MIVYLQKIIYCHIYVIARFILLQILVYRIELRLFGCFFIIIIYILCFIFVIFCIRFEAMLIYFILLFGEACLSCFVLMLNYFNFVILFFKAVIFCIRIFSFSFIIFCFTFILGLIFI